MTFGNFFDNIYVINLDRRPDRMDLFKDEAERIKLRFQRFPAVEGKIVQEENDRRKMELGCKLSHLRILRDAKKNDYRSILILEDDVVFTDDAVVKTANCLKYLSDNNLSWEMLYLGHHDINKTKVILSDDCCTVRTGFTTHAYAVNGFAYDVLIEALDFRGQADVLYADFIHPRGHSYAVYPNVAHQRDGLSDITLSHESYEMLK